MLQPARVAGNGEGLLDLLVADPHLGPFLSLPGKDNGLDLEGLAVVGPTRSRVLLGLRGPVLRGWAVIVEIEPRPDPVHPDDARFRLLFVDLDGLGVRDLARCGDDLLVLAGPTMLLDRPSTLLRIPGGAAGQLPEVVRAADLVPVARTLPVGVGQDHPEAVTPMPASGAATRLLLLYDSPSPARQVPGGVLADLLPLP